MDGSSSEGKPRIILLPSARSSAPLDGADPLEALQTHCSRLDSKITSLTTQLDALEQALQEEKAYRDQLASELASTQNKLHASREVQSHFLDNMSHELRTPLNGILGMAQLMLDTPSSPETKEYAEEIQDAGQHLDRIIGNILDYSILSKGAFPLEISIFDLLSSIESVVSAYAVQAFGEGIELILRAAPAVNRSIEADRKRLMQVLDLVLNNAIKFTKTGTVIVEATIGSGVNQDELTLTVKDTGIGIDPAHLDMIFEPLWQVDQSTSRNYGGIGMGLALCKALTVRMGGRIAAEQAPERGTTLSISLPLTTHAYPAPAPAPQFQELTFGLMTSSREVNDLLKSYLDAWSAAYKDINRTASADLPENPVDILIVETAFGSIPESDLLSRYIARYAQPPRVIALVPPSTTIPPSQKLHYDIIVSKPVFRQGLKEAIEFVQHMVKRQTIEQTAPSYTTKSADSNKVLLIEGNKINQKILSHLLNSLGQEIYTATSLEEGLAHLENEQYAAILINTVFSQSADLKILHELIKVNRLQSNSNIIAFSGKTNGEEVQIFEKAGINKFLTLPSNIEQLRSLLQG